MDQTPQVKKEYEMFQELREYVLILHEDLEILKMKPYRIRVIIGILRLLVADKSNNNGGLLMYFLKNYNVQEKILHYGIPQTIGEYMDRQTLGVSDGANSKQWTLTDIIYYYASQDGAAHSSVSRSLPVRHFNTAALLHSGNTILGVARFFEPCAVEILDFAKRVINELELRAKKENAVE